MFVVLNRLSNNNVVESITSSFQTELTDQFLLYRNDEDEITGVWFYSTEERGEIARLLDDLAMLAKREEAGPTFSSGPETAEVAPVSAPTQSLTQSEELSSAVAPSAHVSGVGNSSERAVAEVPTTKNTVAAFFSMMQSSIPASSAPPMPTGSTTGCDSSNGVEGMSSTFAEEQEEGVGPVDLVEVKSLLKARLLCLLEDDSFISSVAEEYVSQARGAGLGAQGFVGLLAGLKL